MKIGGTSVQCSAKALGDPWGGVSKECECGREDVPTTPPKCDMPTGCNAAHDRYDNLDCDGDGIPDHVCTTTINSNVWMVLSSEGCPNSWGTSQRSKTLCPRKFPCGTWQYTANAAIYGHNDVHFDDVTIDICKQACCDDSQCKSFDYHKQTNQCDLSYSSASEVGGLKTDYAGNPYDHYALTRAAEQQEETSVAKKEADVTLDSLTTKSFPYHHVTLFFAAIGFAATSYVLYHHCNKEAKYQEVHSEI